MAAAERLESAPGALATIKAATAVTSEKRTLTIESADTPDSFMRLEMMLSAAMTTPENPASATPARPAIGSSREKPDRPVLTTIARATTAPTRAQCNDVSRRPAFEPAPLLRPSTPQSATAAGGNAGKGQVHCSRLDQSKRAEITQPGHERGDVDRNHLPPRGAQQADLAAAEYGEAATEHGRHGPEGHQRNIEQAEVAE